MKITLRKASVLQNEIQEAIKSITLKGRVSLNEFQDSTAALASAKSELLGNLGKISALSNALASIRAQVGEANVASGVHGRLAHLSVVDKMIGRYVELVDATNRAEDSAVVEGKVNKLRTRDKGHYYGAEEVETGVLSIPDMEILETNLRDLRKHKQKLNDEILESNIRTEIEISADIVTVLEAQKLV
jgi:hypothetical protein